jgi:hypothetical protein
VRWRTKLARYDEWTSWYAWYPVIVNDEYVWFEKVYRRQTRIGGNRNGWIYKGIFDMLKNSGSENQVSMQAMSAKSSGAHPTPGAQYIRTIVGGVRND